VGGEKMKNPGGILTLLDEKVTKTLKQDTEDSQTRDGMDVAFCKINLKKRKLEYAGAHRPLYMLKQGELQEFKGDKFPIGGAQYKTRTEFTNHEIDIEEGDRIFFCSDGFPDQFNAENKKFSPKRIRELIEHHKDIPVYEMYQVMDREFEQWKGETRQLDDVLMIGIGF
jgi:serine phosphatase RsbU (regulator of sigma subunit)